MFVLVRALGYDDRPRRRFGVLRVSVWIPANDGMDLALPSFSQQSTRNFYSLNYFLQISRIYATAQLPPHLSRDQIAEHDATMVRDHQLLPRASHGVEWMLIGGSGLSRKHRSHPGCPHCWWRYHRLREDWICAFNRSWMHCRTSGMTSCYMYYPPPTRLTNHSTCSVATA